MAKEKKYIYRVDEAAKKVYIDETVIPTESDKIRYTAYIAGGYKTHIKSQKKVEAGKKMAEKNKDKLGKKKNKIVS